MKQKLKEWLLRYGPPEIVGIVFGLATAWVVLQFTQSSVAAAFAGTWGENLGFYGYSAIRETLGYFKAHAQHGVFVVLWKSLRNLVLEFGSAELLDSFLVRPFFLYLMPKVVGHFALGIFLGMMVANVSFYILSIVAYELRKKFVKD